MEIIRHDPQTAIRFCNLVETSRPLIENSRLKEDPKTFTFKHVVESRNLVERIAQLNNESNGLYQHIKLVSMVARRIGSLLKDENPDVYQDLNLDQVEVTALFHDIGRFVSHEFHRNDLIAKLYLTKVGLDKIHNDIPEQDRFFDKKPGDQKAVKIVLKKMSTIQKIIDLADVYGKPKPGGGIFTFEEVMKYHVDSRSEIKKKNDMFPSEKTLDDNLIYFAAEYYVKLKEWFMGQGVNPESIRKEIESSHI